MSLQNSDLAEIKAAIYEAMQPIADKVTKHDVTLFGVNHNNGLSADIKAIKVWREARERWEARMMGVIIAIQVIIGAVSYLFDKVINH